MIHQGESQCGFCKGTSSLTKGARLPGFLRFASLSHQRLLAGTPKGQTRKGTVPPWTNNWVKENKE